MNLLRLIWNAFKLMVNFQDKNTPFSLLGVFYMKLVTIVIGSPKL